MSARRCALCLSLLVSMVVVPAAHAGFGFGAPFAIEDGATSDANLDGSPRLEYSATGVWLASWHRGDLAVETDVMISRSLDNGHTWSKPHALNAVPETDSVADYSIRTATDGAGHWVAIWVVDLGFANNIADASIMVARSLDDGETWSAPQVLSTQADIYSTFALLFAAGTPLPWLTTDRAGNWRAAWRATVPTDATGDIDILTSLSTDNGATWSAPVSVSPPNDDQDDGGPRVSAVGTGRWMVMWNYWDFLVSGGMVVSRSNDNGQSWGKPKTVVSYATGDNVRHNISRLDTDGSGNWIGVGDYAEWDLSGSIPVNVTDSDIFIIRSYDNGKTWTLPVPLNPDANDDQRNDAVPIPAHDYAGHWLVAWTSAKMSGTEQDADISACFSANGGVTWTPVIALNTNAAIDGGNDLFGGIKTDANGNWVAVWASYNVLPENKNDEDADIHAATSTFTVGDHLFLLSPNGGEEVTLGNSLPIRWFSLGDTGRRVRINLLKNGKSVLKIKGNATNDGLYRWRIPDDLESGTEYKIRIKSRTIPSIRAASDTRFSIVAP